MKHKKIMARIGAILACVLTVSLLVVPCFADTTTNSTTPCVTVPYGSALDWFNSMIDTRSNNYAYSLLLSLYNGYGDGRFFDVPYLVSGITDLRKTTSFGSFLPLQLSVIPDGGYASSQFHGVVSIDAFSYAVYTDYGMPLYYDTYESGKIDIGVYFETPSNARAVVSFYPSDSNTYTVSYTYNGTYNQNEVSLTLDSILTPDATYTTSQLTKIDVAFTVSEGTTPNLLSVLCELLYVRDICTYDDVVYSPRDFYYGIQASYSVGYDDGNRYGYQIGYDEGYAKGDIDGYHRGFDVGYDVGYSENPNYAKAYDDGYSDALHEIESGDFGRNFLSGVFTAPLKALNSFKIIQWETQTGSIYSISLMTILSAIVGLSLFIWFLKMFAGG